MHYLEELWDSLDFNSIESTVLRVTSVLICLIFHEVCHGIVAYFLGDPTAKKNHRLSLNPLRHIDWLGVAAMIFTGVGWARPVPVNPTYFKKPKVGMAITALAGPISNLLLALWLLQGDYLLYTRSSGGDINQTLFEFVLDTAILSIGLGMFNLIPIPPLDGSKVLAAFLPDKAYGFLMKYERFGLLLIMVLVLAGFFSHFLSDAIYFVFNLFCHIVGFI